MWVGFLSHIIDLKEGYMMKLFSLCVFVRSGREKRNHAVRVCKHVGVCKLAVRNAGVDCELLKSRPS